MVSLLCRSYTACILALALALPLSLFAQEDIAPPPLPSFLEGVESLEDFNWESLTPTEQEEAAEFFAIVGPGAFAQAEPDAPAGTVNCFDYYTFGSVQVSVSPQVGNTVSGVPMTFAGTIDNENPYPIIDGAVYMKIFRLTEDGSTPVNGYDVIDQRFMVEDLSLSANESRPVQFVWDVPAGLTDGTYQAAFYFTSAKRFNLLGLPFTDDVTGNTVSFSVAGELTESVSFDKDSVTVAGDDYYFAAFTPKVSATDPITVTADLTNDTATAQDVPVTWTTYKWDQQRAEHIVSEVTETITLPAGSRQTLTHTVTDTTNAVYLVVAEARYLGVPSILNVRFTRDGVPSTRINFPAVLSYPLVAGSSTELFSCLHGAGTLPLVADGKLTLTLTDETGQPFHTYSYEGDITGAMMAVADTFTPATDHHTFTLTASLSRGGELVEEVSLRYDCAALGSCPVVPEVDNTATFSLADELSTGQYVFIIVLAGLLAGLVYHAVLKRRPDEVYEIDPPTDGLDGGPRPPVALLLGLLTAATVLTAVPGESMAAGKSVTWSGNESSALAYCWNNGIFFGLGNTCSDYYISGQNISWGPGLTSPSMQVTYHARVKNLDTGDYIVDGTSVPVGTQLQFEAGSFSRTDISWFGTGHSEDSPYGHFVLEANRPPGNPCDASNFINIDSSGIVTGYPVYVAYSVNPPAVSYANTGTASLTCNASNQICTVNSPGSITGRVTFGDTISKFHYAYAYKDQEPSLFGVTGYDGKCIWNDRPMRKELSSFVLYSLFNVNASRVGNGDFIKTVPNQEITFNLTAVGGPSNTPPNPPSIAGDAANSHLAGTPQDFTITATDDDGDDIRFGVDWNTDGLVDQWVPATGYVPSGSNLTVSRTWMTGGDKDFTVLTEDDQAARSAATPHTHTLCAASGETWDGASCVPITYSCTNAPIPANASLYGGDNTGLTADTAYTYAAADTAAKCEYRCDTGYVWNGSLCVSGGTPITPQTPTPISCPDPNPTVRDSEVFAITQALDINGSIAYVGASDHNPTNGLYIYDVSDAENLQQLSFFPTTQSVLDVEIQGSYAYVTTYWGGLYVIDVSDVTAPVLASYTEIVADAAIPNSYEVWDVEVRGDYAFVSVGAGLAVYDISNKASVNKVDFVNLGISVAQDVILDGDYAFVSGRTHGIRSVDISDPNNLVEVGSYSAGFGNNDWSYDIELFNEYLYVGNHDPSGSTNGSIKVFDVSIPAAPSFINEVGLPGAPKPRSFRIDDGVLYLGMDRAGAAVFDITDPTAPSMEYVVPEPSLSATKKVWNVAQLPGGSFTDLLVTSQDMIQASLYSLRTTCQNDSIEVCDLFGDQIARGGQTVSFLRNDGDLDQYQVFYDDTFDCSGTDITATVSAPDTDLNPTTSAIDVTQGATLDVTATNPDPGDRTEDVEVAYGGETITLTYTVRESVVPACGNAPRPANTVPLGADGTTLSGHVWAYSTTDVSDCDYVCADDFTWNPAESRCVKGDLTTSAAVVGTTCSIPDGSKTCTFDLNWTVDGVNNGYITEGGTTMPSIPPINANGSEPGITLDRGESRTYRLYDDGMIPSLDDIDVTAECSGAWNILLTPPACDGGPSGTPDIDITATPDLIRSGTDATLHVDITSSDAITCNFVPNSRMLPPSTITHSGSPATDDYDRKTVPLSSTQQIRLECEYDAWPSIPIASEEATVRLVPAIQEI